MIQLRKSEDRGGANHGWLNAKHTFSFANYYDERFTGFRDLLVINEDRIQPGQGFGKHSHTDMEIITYVLEGELAHKDSMGTSSVLRAGRIQRMSAGRGVAHSEFNNSKDKPLHLYQIWIAPREEGLAADYEEKNFLPADRRNRLQLLVSPKGDDGSLHINQDVNLYSSYLDKGKDLEYKFGEGRYGWIQVAKGSVSLNGQSLNEGDGAALSSERDIKIIGQSDAELLLFDLP